MTVAWTTVEDAVHAWVATASGITGSKVIWTGQNGARPAVPYIEVGLDVQRLGQDWIDTADAASPSPENEIDYLARGNRRLIVTINAYGTPSTGTSTAKALLDAVMSKFKLPSIHDALVVAGVGVSTFGDIIDISAALNTSKIETRASLEAVAFLASEVSETGTYISDVDVTDQISVPDNEFTVEGGI